MTVSFFTIVIAVRKAPPAAPAAAPAPAAAKKILFLILSTKKIFWIFWLTLFSCTLFSGATLFSWHFHFFLWLLANYFKRTGK